jgi:hypothetical protein
VANTTVLKPLVAGRLRIPAGVTNISRGALPSTEKPLKLQAGTDAGGIPHLDTEWLARNRRIRLIYCSTNRWRASTTAMKEAGRTVIDLLPGNTGREILHPVGRMDMDTSVSFCSPTTANYHRLTQPLFREGKEYLIVLDRKLMQGTCPLRSGLE